ncbi:uncharacterized protein [Cicer arietinum]|uniref:Protein FANTASTIC FOUR 1 n=1 Tax=Cicer arietinum TaxID=3827 RepID=A0A1S2XL90_CICAR|nr:protein FANTASTIC FOUR 1 [Cicer arietinum]
MTFRSKTYSSNYDDYIGYESCIDLQPENNVVNIDHNAPSVDKKIKNIRNKGKNKVFPPPLHFLAQTQNLASHMPWVLKRYYTNEGRLIIKEEKVKHHEYFHAHRENGRLTLQLVPLDHDDYDFMRTSAVEEEQEEEQEQEKEQEEGEEEEEDLASPPPTSPHEVINNVPIDKIVVINNDGFEAEENKDNNRNNVGGGELDVENENEIVGSANSRVNCLNCNSVISAPSGIFGVMPLQPIRRVRG